MTALSRTSGPVSGGVTVTLTGTSMPTAGSGYCAFGTRVVAATLNTATTLSCLAPGHAAGTVTVEVSNNNVDFSSSGITYQYQGM